MSHSRTARRARRGLVAAAVIAVVTVTAPALGPATAFAAPTRHPRGWTVVPSDNVPGADSNFLAGVSCVRGPYCVAVGNFDVTADGHGPSTLALHGDAQQWSVVPTPNRTTNAVANLLGGVACVSRTHCFAVGASSAPNTLLSHALVEQWDGRAWTIVPVPEPPGADGTNLRGVACTDASFCVAVGNWRGTDGAFHGLIERWDGRRWSFETSPAPPGSIFPDLAGVSCTGRANCVAVGRSLTPTGSFGLIIHWNGANWRTEPSPSANGISLTSVACARARRCYAAGDLITGPAARHAPHIERWDGKRWQTVAVPSAPGALESSLASVACEPSRCFAVGDGTGPTTTDAFILRLHGRHATIEPIAPLPASSFSLLMAVSCAGRRDGCFTVGQTGVTGGFLGETLVEHRR
jgi:hypothetical protein